MVGFGELHGIQCVHEQRLQIRLLAVRRLHRLAHVGVRDVEFATRVRAVADAVALDALGVDWSATVIAQVRAREFADDVMTFEARQHDGHMFCISNAIQYLSHIRISEILAHLSIRTELNVAHRPMFLPWRIERRCSWGYSFRIEFETHSPCLRAEP